MVITIDGLGVNGKTTLAKRIAEKLNFKNFGAGSVYRCIAYKMIKNNLDISDIDKVLELIKDIDVDFVGKDVYLDGEKVTDFIKTEEISVKSTKWATNLKIKEFVRNYQKEFIKKHDTVMEGRDIAERIAPNAEVKFYLYSDFETRVRRLWEADKSVDINEIRNNLKIRDDLDLNGGNFVEPKVAIRIDTTNLTLDEVYEKMMEEINKKIQ